jgi:hypothetical protein
MMYRSSFVYIIIALILLVCAGSFAIGYHHRIVAIEIKEAWVDGVISSTELANKYYNGEIETREEVQKEVIKRYDNYVTDR